MSIFEYRSGEDTTISFLDYQGNPADGKGMVTELTLPEIMRTVDTDSRIGEAGEQQRLLGFEAMEASITMKGISTELDLMLKEKTVISGGGSNSITVQITGKAQDRYSNTTVTIKYTLKGEIKKYPFHTSLTPNEKAEIELQMTVWGFGHELGTGNNFYFEPQAKKWEVNGVNLWT
ncbi:MAG: hypothetical protein F6K31_03200 [Symploca sp. SIO2G7]|nr:hypothetical protein [Symploca sp. SIO2G7]